MSIKVMTLVWENFKRGGSEKLAMLALADWCNDDGGSLHPSIKGVAEKINSSESQARRIIHKFIDEGLLTVIANHGGGNPGQSRHYKLNIGMLSTPSTHDTRTPCTDATPSIDATPSTHARDPLHPCALPLAPMTPEPPLTIIKPSLVKKTKINKSIPVPEKFEVTPKMFDWACEQGIPEDKIKIETEQFVDRNKSLGSKYIDWNAAWRTWMRNSVKFAKQRKYN